MRDLLLAIMLYAAPVEPTPIQQNVPVVSPQEITCLAENIYHEARGEGEQGMIAVGLVTINRVNSPKFPDKICHVVHERNKWGCQFSWVCDEKLVRKKKKSEAWDASYAGALKVIYDFRSHHNIVPNALFYHAKHVEFPQSFRKKLTEVAVVGNHIFFRGKDL